MTSTPPQHPDLVLCVFPHLQEFLAIHLRNSAPAAKPAQVLRTEVVFTEEFFQEAEEAFGLLLRQEGPPFANLMMLPQQVEQMMRHHALSAILDRLGHEGDDASVTVFLCTGPVLTMDSLQLTSTLRDMAGPDTPPWLVMEWLQELELLLLKERDRALQTEREEAQEALLEDSATFFSLWDARN